jgi:pimeloyl-ACP methyl ester carboxylesterase
MSGLNGAQARTLPVWQNRVNMRVVSKGKGPALIFFHGPWGLHWNPFLDALAQHFTVHAPEHPGTSPGAPDDIHHLDNLWDLVLCYDELLEQLGVENAAFVGHSFGAMVACEVAAAYPRRAGRLALIDPIGLWRDDAPVTNWMMLNQQEMQSYIFHDPEGAGAKLLFSKPEDETERVNAQVGLTWAMGSTGKFIWPIPDKGLKKRIHRVKAPTLLIWGAEDRIAPPVYAEEFARQIAGAKVETVKSAGHAPHLEQPAAVAESVRAFLRS